MQEDESVPKMTVDVQPREMEVNMQQGNEILVSEDMSTGDSEEEEDGSDGFSDRSISGGETDKMDAAPDTTTSPTAVEANAALDATTSPTAVEANAAPDATTPPTTVGANTAPDAPTPSSIEEATAARNVLTPPTPVAPNTPVHSTTDESISKIKDVGTDTTAVACREQALAPLSVELPSDILVANEIAVPADVARPLAVEGWGRDALMVEGIFRIIEGLEPPWITLNVLEVAALQFLMVGREVLRHTIMTIHMSQRHCVIRLTRAGLRLELLNCCV